MKFKVQKVSENSGILIIENKTTIYYAVFVLDENYEASCINHWSEPKGGIANGKL